MFRLFDPVAVITNTLVPTLRAPAWSSSISQLDPKRGDMIEFSRGAYNHWALYLGDGEVVHFNPTSGEFDKNNALKYVDGKITIDSLTSIAGSSELRINNKSHTKLDGSSLSSIKSKVELLLTNYNRNGGLRYNLSDFNCEHFVTFLKFGVAFSEQDENVRKLFAHSMPSPLPIFGGALQVLAHDIDRILRGKACQRQWEENLAAAEGRRKPKFIM